ncbi:MAG: hypothetical protein GY944_30550 [bacterium]|nr:hypothetical protein [bacterium]
MRSAIIRLGLIFALFLTALGAGYALSSTLGQGAVRREAETQLAKLMRGRVAIDRADVRIRRGLWIEGRGLRVYPSPDGPGLSSERVAARLDVIALLTGRFRVLDLVIEGVHMEIERNLADRWSPYPINAIDKRGQAGDPDDLERTLGTLKVIDVITRTLLERPFIAQRIEVKNGSVRVTDRFVRAKGSDPLQVQIDDVNGKLVHDWLGGDAKLELAGTLSDELGSRVPIEIYGERGTDAEMQLSIAFTKLELATYRAYFQNQDLASRRGREAGEVDPARRPFAGRASGVIRYETPELEHGVLELDWAADDLRLGVPRGDDDLDFSSPQLALRARVEVHPGRVRISNLDLVGPNLVIDASGDIERPLRGSSPTRFAVYFKDVGLDAIDRIVNALPEAEREPLLRTLGRIEEGRIVRVGGSGTERFSVWQAVLRGERLDLPPGLSMQASVEDVTLQLGDYERLTDLSGSATWTRDRIRIHRAHATRSGRPTPSLNLTLEGFPSLFDDPVAFDAKRVTSAGLPGIALLGRIFAGEPEPDLDAQVPPDDTPVEIEIEVDYIEHSALIWPLRNAKLDAVLQRGSQSFRVQQGRWGGAQLQGDVLLTYDPIPTVDAHLKVWKEAVATADSGRGAEPAPPAASKAGGATGWAAGRFLVDGVHGKHWPVGPTVTDFTFDGESLTLGDLHGRLVPRGRLEGSYKLDFSSGEKLAFATDFVIRDGDAAQLLEAVGFPDDFATGTLDVKGTLEGPMFPGRNPFAEVEGKISFDARQGEIRQSIPLVAALAHAAEGLSPARASDTLLYETVETEVRFERGSISSEEIKIDGPLRVFVSGRFDFAKPGHEIDAEIGIFLFRQVDRLLGNLPLLGSLIPGGKDRGLFGAFFDVEGTLEDPVLTAMPMKSLTDGVPLPDLVKAPFSAIREALQGDNETEAGKSNPSQKEPRS